MCNVEDNTLLEVKNLRVHYETRDYVYEAVNGVSFRIKKGETMGLVGETGAGKTTIAKSIMGLLPYPPAHVLEGEIRLEGVNLLEKDKNYLRKTLHKRISKKDKDYMLNVRGRRISMVFQDPMTALNPTMRVGDQIAEVIKVQKKVSRAEAKVMAADMLKMVGIQENRIDEYPHQFSGGMKQRVVLAIALACRPDLIIADEPTTALDVTIQAQVLELMKELQEEIGTAMLLITHDLGVVAETCDTCAVIYAGEIVEYGSIEDIFNHCMHPYTEGLFNSIPHLDEDAERLISIEGLASDPTNLPEYCSFYERCPRRQDRCRRCDPKAQEVSSGHFVKCLFPQEC